MYGYLTLRALAAQCVHYVRAAPLKRELLCVPGVWASNPPLKVLAALCTLLDVIPTVQSTLQSVPCSKVSRSKALAAECAPCEGIPSESVRCRVYTVNGPPPEALAAVCTLHTGISPLKSSLQCGPYVRAPPSPRRTVQRVPHQNTRYSDYPI